MHWRLPAAKGKKAKRGRDLLRSRFSGGEAFGVEAEGVGPEAVVAMDDELRSYDNGSARDGVAGDLVGISQVRAMVQTGG